MNPQIYRNTSTSYFLVVLLAFLTTACGSTDDPQLLDKIKNKKGTEYHISQEALSRLKLPEPGIDTANAIAVVDYPDEKIIEILAGPEDIPAHTEHLWFPAKVTAMPFDVWIHGFDWEVTDKDKNIITTDVLHHTNIIDPNKREIFYPIARRLFASSNDTPGGEMPSFVGVPLKKDDPMLVNVMYQNLTDSVIKDVYLRILFSYTDGDGLIGPMEVYPLYLDAGGPLLPRDFDVPPGKLVKKNTSEPVVSGKILAAGSHLHNYGKMIELVDETGKDTIWKAKPDETKEGYVKHSESRIFFPFSKKIDKNHNYSIVAVYENPTDEKSEDMGMGTIGALFKPSGDEGWQKADYSDPTYIDDMVLMLGAPVVGQWRGITADQMRKKLGISGEYH